MRRGMHKKPARIFEAHEADERLADVFRNHEFGDFPHAERLRLVEFYQLLMHHQLRDNVTRLILFRDIAIKHFIDSLIVDRLTTLTFPLLDIGTGPGFPGIPLKIIHPNDKILLAEGVKRRVDFLKAVREQMQLNELQIVGRNIDSTFELPVKGAITRAVEDVAVTLKRLTGCLETGGRVFLMKGPGVDPEIKKAKADPEIQEQFRLVNDIDYELPKTPHKRRLVIFERIQR